MSLFSRIAFLMITGFWLTMTYLLWRSEYVGQNEMGSSVPVELVWQKILNAPEWSTFDVIRDGHKIGSCTWTSNLGLEASANRMLSDDVPPQAMAPRITGYSLEFHGTVIINELPGSVYTSAELKLDTNQSWQEFYSKLQFNYKTRSPHETHETFEVHASQPSQSMSVKLYDPQPIIDRTFKFSDFQNPQMMLQQFDIPGPLGMIGMLGQLQGAQGTNLSLGLQWTARNDWIQIGHTSVRAYRLEAQLFDKYRMRIIVNPVGEILRVDLPDNWQLLNNQLSNF